MAIRFDATGDKYTRTTAVPAFGAFTIAGWFRMVVNRLAWSSPFALSFNTSEYRMLYTHTDGVTLRVQNQQSGSATEADVRLLTVGEWYYLALVGNGTSLTGYAIKLGETVVTKASVTAPVPFSASTIIIGDDAWVQPWDGRAAAIKIYDAALSDADILEEMQQYVPWRTANLNSWYPLLSTDDDETDYSGNGRTLTVNGTLTTEDGPPIPWERPPVVAPESGQDVFAGGELHYDPGAGGERIPRPRARTIDWNLTHVLHPARGRQLLGICSEEETQTLIASAMASVPVAIGMVPVGGIIYWAKNRSKCPALPPHFAECNGQLLIDKDSPFHEQTLPNLTAENDLVWIIRIK